MSTTGSKSLSVLYACFFIYVNNLKQSIQNRDMTLCFKAKEQAEPEIKAFIDLSSSIKFFSELNLNQTDPNQTLLIFAFKTKMKK